MKRLLCALIVIGIAAGGCANQYESDRQKKILENQNVPPVNFKPDLLAFMQTYLNNPEAVRDAAMSEPTRLTVIDLERYAACVRYNARNSSGRYTGLRDHLAVFVSRKFDRLIELGRADREPRGASGLMVGSPALQPLREYCATATHQPFPELEKLRR